MKTTIVKTVMAATMLLSMVLGQGEGTATATAATVTSKAPVMTDNLSKYGLKKDVDLPVTVTAGGLSYTLEKIMIYDINSATAKELIKKYGYSGDGKYFIWTKITIENKSGNTVQHNYKDLTDKWRLFFGDDEVYLTMPLVKAYSPNDKDALWDWSLKPGAKFSSYQAYLYDSSFKSFYIRVDNKGKHEYKNIVLPVK